jgi:[protein-PII] uridylyltransferase
VRGHIAHAALERALERTAKADQTVRSLLHPFRNQAEGLLVLATGGYARADLAPHSDLDIVILLDDPKKHEETVKAFVQALWDSTYQPAQTVVTLKDLDSRLFTIPDKASSLLETRVLWGDKKLASLYETRVNQLITDDVYSEYVVRKQEEFAARRVKFGAVPRVIEPHLKNEAGGFRDLHHVFWLERAQTAQQNRWQVRKRRGNMLLSFFRRLQTDNQLSDFEMEELAEAYGFLLAVRESLHRFKQKSEDRLTVTEQPGIALELGYLGSERLTMIDLMREVYLATEKHSRFCEEFGPRFAHPEMDTEQNLDSPIQLPDQLRISHNRLELPPKALTLYATDPNLLGALVDSSVEAGLPFSGRSRHALRRALHVSKGSQHDVTSWTDLIRRWLQLPSGFSQRMRRLDELDAIHLWLPEWMEITGFTTGSYYHRYTVDEHTLRAIDQLDKLPASGIHSDPKSLWDECEFRPLVYLSLIFHDIAKARGIDHSGEGARMAEDALKRIGLEQWAEGVAKLVRIHLRMEQLAFRRDFSDPDIVAEFVSMVEDENSLAALYILTVCDLNAVRSGVWTTWKGRLLSELYHVTLQILHHGLDSRRGSVEQEVQRVAPLLTESGNEHDRAEEFISALEVDYRRSVPAEEIANHLETVDSLHRGDLNHKWLIKTPPGFVIITLITRDRSGLLADVTGLLTAQGIGIREARIFTRPDGIIIDRFRCEDIEPTQLPLQDRLRQIPVHWSKLSAGELKMDDLFARFQRRTRVDRKTVVEVVSDVTIHPLINGAMLDVSGADSVGLLYRLCSIFAEEGFEIRSARVTGKVDGIMDSFLIKDPSGRLESKDQQEELMRRLHDAANVTLHAKA